MEMALSRQAVLEEIVNRKNMGDKRFHSETSLQNLGEEEGNRNSSFRDPGVHNSSLNNVRRAESQPRVRHTSQPGPMSGNLVTATAARAARRKPLRSVNYAPDLERTDSASGPPTPKLFLSPGNDSGTATPTLVERINPVAYMNNFRNGDAKSLNSYRMYASDSRGGVTPRKRSVVTNNDALSIRSIETHAPPPTTPEDNKRLSMKYLSLITSSMYAILLITLGIIIFVAEPFMENPIATYYSMILTAISILYHFYLIIDINKYKLIARKNEKIKDLNDENLTEYFRKQEADYGIEDGSETGMPPKPPIPLTPLTHNYCFSSGRHSGSFYLKIGAAAFAVGHLIHSLLLIAIQFALLFDDSVSNDDCLEIDRVVLDFVVPINCFLQLYFIFKYSNVIILRHQSLAYFGFMHMIGSSICFWVSTIVRETILALTLYASSVKDKYEDANGSSEENDLSYENQYDRNSTTIEKNAYSYQNYINIGSFVKEECTGPKAISSIYENYSPYLYPFSVEFNILIVAVYYIIWSNIGNCENEFNNYDGTSLDENYNVCKLPTASINNDYTSNVVIYADCHASNRGMFAGLVVIVVIAGTLIISYVFSSVDDTYYKTWGYLVTDCVKLLLNLMMLLAAVLAYNQLRKLDINEHPISLLDDILLFVCLPAVFMEVALSLAATFSILNIVRSLDFVIMVVQVVIQTALIVDGLRRCSNNRKLRRTKPGRELVMFLIIANVGTWLLNTLSYKSPETFDERYVYYGKILWTILGHVTLPLIMFYRFHSSVCFADIWNSAYTPGSEH